MVFFYSFVPCLIVTPWRNGSASDSRSEDCVFESRRGQLIFYILNHFTIHAAETNVLVEYCRDALHLYSGPGQI